MNYDIPKKLAKTIKVMLEKEMLIKVRPSTDPLRRHAAKLHTLLFFFVCRSRPRTR